MESIVKAEIKRAVCSFPFLIGVGLMAAVCLLSSLDGIGAALKQAAPYGNHHQVFLNAVTSSAMVQFAVPILCVLPATTAFLDDISSGFVKSYLPRIGKYAYIKGKVIACAVSGGGTLVLGALISWLATTLLLFPTEVVLKANEVPPYYVHKLLTVFSLLFLNGAFWALLGMVLASVTASRYMAYAAPFVTYYLLVILHERFFPRLVSIYPKAWLVSETGLQLPLLLLELMVLLCIAFSAYAERRLSNV